MQELRSTEILDKEIQSEARKKVELILQKADQECEALLAGVDQKVIEAKKEKEEFYANKLAVSKSDLNASGPLEKQRFEVSFIQDSVINAINEYLAGLKESQRVEIVSSKFDFSVINTDSKINAYVYGFDLAEAKKMLSKKLGSKLGSCEKTEFGKFIVEDDIGLTNNQGIILESEDKAFRCRLTLVEVFNRILDKNRAELATALFGE